MPPPAAAAGAAAAGAAAAAAAAAGSAVASASVRVVKVSGLVPYLLAWDVQRHLAAKLADQASQRGGNNLQHSLILLQHRPVYTVGIRSLEYSGLEEERLRALGAEFVRSNRGGLITFHGPGQLTAYPILHLTALNRSLKWYVCALERTVMRACAALGLETHSSPHTGVWVNSAAKICAIGIQGRRVTTHGIALNCSTDLSWFNHIVPCGLLGKSVTSLTQELGRQVPVEEAAEHFLDAFAQVFQCHLTDREKETTPEQFHSLLLQNE